MLFGPSESAILQLEDPDCEEGSNPPCESIFSLNAEKILVSCICLLLHSVKGLVQAKMKILSLFSYPHFDLLSFEHRSEPLKNID